MDVAIGEIHAAVETNAGRGTVDDAWTRRTTAWKNNSRI